MNWMGALLETYDRCYDETRLNEGRTPLLPICHTLGNAHVTVTINYDGQFITAETVPKDAQNTIIQSTEESAGRTSGASPHGLTEKIPYLIKDFADFCKTPKRTYAEAYELYMEQLSNWQNSPFSTGVVKAVYTYISGGTLYRDLIETGILVENEDGKLSENDPRSEEPRFSIPGVTKQQDVCIRWSVYNGEIIVNSWNNPDVINSWIAFTKSSESKTGLCYVTGKETTLAQNHPRRIRNAADGAKIISSNDSTEFTYRGRFETPDQAFGVGFDSTQKIHNALRWLIDKQGYHQDTLCVVAWNTLDADMTNPLDDPYEMVEVSRDTGFTNAEAAKHINQRIRGYNAKIIDTNVYILALDSAVNNKGRICITLFRDKKGTQFLETLEKWHIECAWKHSYAMVQGKKTTFIGAPSPRDIANAAYGSKADDKIKTNVVKRILPCIIDGNPIPLDIVESVVRRASNPIAFEKDWEWRKTLTIACSLFKKYKGGNYNMVLEEDRNSRDYLYGRLLALADLLEEAALKKAGENRQTNAIRLMQRFSEFPYSTWRDIELALIPYMARLGPKLAGYYEGRIAEVMSMFNGDDFRNNSRLSGEFLLAYHCQKEKQFEKKNEEE